MDTLSNNAAFLHLMELKDSDLRTDMLKQCDTAVDGGIHIGGAFSCLLPMAALFFGGIIHLNVEQPTAPGQDVFILSKGHCVAALASVYADLGYFDKTWLWGSRSYESMLNGHPGPLLPGVPISTGPLGQGLPASCGFAVAAKNYGQGDVYCMLGDGELQEGSNWEAIMYASARKLDNLCAIVDANGGQSDSVRCMVVEMGSIGAKFAAFGWHVIEADGTNYASVLAAYEQFKAGVGDGRPTVIIAHTQKGFGGFSEECIKHKSNIPKVLLKQEVVLQQSRRQRRLERLSGMDGTGLQQHAARLGYKLVLDKVGGITGAQKLESAVRTQPAQPRDKALHYDKLALPAPEKGIEYMCDAVAMQAIRAFAQDERLYSLDADLSNASSLQAGVAAVDRTRGLNVGIAENLMMCMGEALAANGANVWTSTFTPFFDWRAFRRIAVSQSERLEAIAQKDGWLSEGHGLDLTFMATAPNFETQTNGATHMGNDDANVYDEIAHLRVIDLCCPRQLVAAMEWVAEGGKGLVYLRVPRMKTKTLYGPDYRFEFGRGRWLRRPKVYKCVIISSGRGVHEALATAELLEQEDIHVAVVDMPSIDAELMKELAGSGNHLLFAEQNNGYLAAAFARTMMLEGVSVDVTRLHRVSALKENGHRRFIHSGTYGQIVEALGLDASSLAARIKAL